MTDRTVFYTQFFFIYSTTTLVYRIFIYDLTMSSEISTILPEFSNCQKSPSFPISRSGVREFLIRRTSCLCLLSSILSSMKSVRKTGDWPLTLFCEVTPFSSKRTVRSGFNLELGPPSPHIVSYGSRLSVNCQFAVDRRFSSVSVFEFGDMIDGRSEYQIATARRGW